MNESASIRSYLVLHLEVEYIQPIVLVYLSLLMCILREETTLLTSTTNSGGDGLEERGKIQS